MGFFKAGKGMYANSGSLKLALYISNSNFINLGFALKSDIKICFLAQFNLVP